VPGSPRSCPRSWARSCRVRPFGVVARGAVGMTRSTHYARWEGTKLTGGAKFHSCRFLKKEKFFFHEGAAWEEEEEEEEFFNHYKNGLKRHAHTPSGVAGAVSRPPLMLCCAAPLLCCAASLGVLAQVGGFHVVDVLHHPLHSRALVDLGIEAASSPRGPALVVDDEHGAAIEARDGLILDQGDV